MTDMRWKENTCPICERTFTVTPSDDYLVPGCGCFDEVEAGHYPCESCGLKHYYACLDKGDPPTRRLTAIVENGVVIAQVEGGLEGAALADEFFVNPERPAHPTPSFADPRDCA